MDTDTDTPNAIILTAAQSERHADGDATVMAYAREQARTMVEARRRWNTTARRARLPRVTARVNIFTADGVLLGFEV